VCPPPPNTLVPQHHEAHSPHLSSIAQVTNEVALRCIFTNCASISNKLPELTDLAAHISPHLILLTETWLTSDVPDSEIDLPGYVLHRFDSTRGRTGGVCLFATNTLPLSVAPMTPNYLTFVDSLWLTLRLKGRDTLLIGLIYRSPSSSTEDDVFLSNLLQRIHDLNYSHLLILGDFNCPTINWRTLSSPNCGLAPILLSTTVSLGWHQHSLHPTRFRTGQRPSVLDLIFTNEREMIDEVTTLSPLGKSDHAVLSWDLLCYWQSILPPNIPRFAYHRGDYAGMSNYLNSVDWQSLCHLSPEDLEYEISYHISSACRRYIPTFVPSDNKSHKYPGRIRRMLNRKRTAWARYIRTQCDRDFQSYLILRRQSVLEIKSYKKHNEAQLLARAQSSPKILYRFLRSHRKSKPAPLSLRDSSGIVTHSPEEAAQTLANVYTTVLTPVTTLPLSPSHSQSQVQNSLEHVSFPLADVVKLLSLCDPGGSPGPDCIHPKVLKECASALALPYQLLFSLSFSSGVLPSPWRRAIIHPVYKGGDRHDPSNYRPISLTSIPCKLMEKVINRSLLGYLQSNKLLHSAQHGFLPSRSCLTNLTLFLSDLTLAAETNTPTDCIFFDFSRAFDKLPHAILIRRWEDLGICGFLSRWLSAFILHRSSQVRVSGFLSSSFEVTSGVPQGSVLGPTLFLLFINSLCSLLPPDCKALLYADDLKIWSSNPCALQDAVSVCASWASTNVLPINSQKTVHMSFRNPSPPSFILPTQAGLTPIPTVSHHKDLGIWLTADLSPSMMVLHSSKKAIRMVNLFRRTFPNLDQRNFTLLYSGFIHPLIEYCSIAWLPWLKRDENLLENVQRKATKNVIQLRKLPYPERLNRLNLYPLKYRRLRGCLIFTFHLFHSKSHEHFFTLSHNTNLRGHSLKVYQHRYVTRPRRNFFSSVVIPTWNKLPEAVVSAPSVQVFKQQIDALLPKLIP
jgi:hypothetical protein